MIDAATDLLTINGEFTLSLVLVRCRQTAAGSLRWQIHLDTGLLPDLTVAVRMDALNKQALDYYLLPHSTCRCRVSVSPRTTACPWTAIVLTRSTLCTS